MRTHAPFALLALMLGGLIGCQSPPTYFTARDSGPVWDDRGNARSLVMDTDALRLATLELPADPAEPWYLGRNDVGPSVSSGFITPRFEQTITTTRDSQRTFGGRVYDRYDETTYRRSIREAYR